MKFDSKLLHAGYDPLEDPNLSISPPIHRTTAYQFKNTEHAANLFGLKEFGNIYSRMGNPTVAILENRLAALEGGAAALCLSSGTSAVMYSIINICKQGDNIVTSTQLYGGTYTMFSNILPDFGITAKKIDLTDLDLLESSIDSKTKAIFCETITNPGLVVADLESLSEIAHSKGIPLIVDATFTTPAIQKSFDFGADIVVHSLTKWMSGNGSVIAGAVVEKGGFEWGNGNFFLYDEPDTSYGGMRWGHDLGDLSQIAYTLRMRTVPLRNLGANMAPDTAWQVLQGMETLGLRMERHSQNALATAEYLSENKLVDWVRFPGLKEDSNYKLSEKYLQGTGGTMVVFGIKGGREAGQKFIDNLLMFKHVANVGDSRSLAIHPATTTHSQLDEDALREAGVSPELVRLSIGIEDIDDIKEDLEQALNKSK